MSVSRFAQGTTLNREAMQASASAPSLPPSGRPSRGSAAVGRLDLSSSGSRGPYGEGLPPAASVRSLARSISSSRIPPSARRSKAAAAVYAASLTREAKRRGGSLASARSSARESARQSVRTGRSRTSAPSNPALSTGRSSKYAISEARRSKLRDIERRAQLEATLKQKLAAQYGSIIKPAARRDEIIDQEVRKVLRRDKITPVDIEELENAVALRAATRSKTGNLPGDKFGDPGPVPVDSLRRKAEPRSRWSGSDSDDEWDDALNPLKHTSNDAYGADAVSGLQLNLLPVKRTIGPTPSQRAEEEWNMLRKYDQLKWAEEEKRKKDKLAESKVLTKKELAAQMEEKMAREKAEREALIEEGRRIAADHEAFEREEAAKIAARKERDRQAAEEMDKILQEQIKKKKKLEKAAARADKELAERVQRELEEKEAARQAKMKADREAFKKFIRENDSQIEEKKRAIEREKAEDVKRQEEYNRMIEEQEQARQNFFKTMIADQERRMAQFGAAVVEVQAFNEAALDESIKKHAEEKDRQLKAELEAREERARRLNEETQRALDAQVAEKKKIAELERQEGKAYVDSVLTKLQRDLEDEKRRAREERERRVQNRLELERQIREKHAHSEADVMNDTERVLNRDTLKAATEAALSGKLVDGDTPRTRRL